MCSQLIVFLSRLSAEPAVVCAVLEAVPVPEIFEEEIYRAAIAWLRWSDEVPDETVRRAPAASRRGV